MAVINPTKSLLKRLSEIGYNENYVRRMVLPDWWEDCIALNPAGYEQAVTLLARNLGLDAHSLSEEQGAIRCRVGGQPKYKLKSTDTPERIAVATCIAVRAAQLACQAMPGPVGEILATAPSIRSAILSSGAVCISFEVLLEYCWSIGIPVLHVSEFPAGSRKPDALAVVVDGRPAIVLCKATHYSAWLLFHLAHELGHIVLGHLQGSTVLVDEEVRADTDAEETDANEFAIELLTGYKRRSYNYGDRITAKQLAVVAQAVGRDTDVAPGFIALGHGRMTGNWAAANGALKIMERNPDAIKVMHAKMRRYLELERLSRDSEEFLFRIRGCHAAWPPDPPVAPPAPAKQEALPARDAESAPPS